MARVGVRVGVGVMARVRVRVRVMARVGRVGVGVMARVRVGAGRRRVSSRAAQASAPGPAPIQAPPGTRSALKVGGLCDVPRTRTRTPALTLPLPLPLPLTRRTTAERSSLAISMTKRAEEALYASCR